MGRPPNEGGFVVSKTMLASIAIFVTVVAVAGSTALAKGQKPRSSPEQIVAMQVTSEGFVPAQVKVKAGQPVKLVVTRKTEMTCAKEIVIKDFGINQPLPLNQPVEITFTPTKAGKFRYACGMDMITGVIIVE